MSKESKPKQVTEDDLYRNSTQYRLWSFTKAQLQQKRTEVNKAGKLKAMRKLKNICDKSENGYSFDEFKSLFTTVSEEDEQKEINFYVDVLEKLAVSVLKLPSQAKATAIMFMKRFYLTHSVMEYHPKKVLATCLFVAAKSENCFMPPAMLADLIRSKTTKESILELEFELVRSMSFTLLCHHPYRALHGFFFDFQSVLIHKHPEGVVVIRDDKNGEKKKLRVKYDNERITKAYASAREYCDKSFISDASFYYTPPQIALACLLKVDKELTTAFLTYKFVKNGEKDKAEEKSSEPVSTATSSDSGISIDSSSKGVKKEEANVSLPPKSEADFKPNHIAQLKKLMSTLKSCIKDIESVKMPSKEETKEIDGVVRYCLNPEKWLKRKRQESPNEPEGPELKKVKLETSQ